MNNNGTLLPVNLVGGAMVAQVSLLSIIFIGGLLVRRSDRVARLWDRPTLAGFAWLTLALALGTLGALGTTDAFSEVWSPLFGPENLAPFLSWSQALLLTFVLDIVVISILVVRTGGGQNSPFQSLYFLIPTLAVFLREPTKQVLLYLVLVAISFSASMFVESYRERDEEARWRFAYWFVSIASFVLAAYIGLITRPS